MNRSGTSLSYNSQTSFGFSSEHFDFPCLPCFGYYLISFWYSWGSENRSTHCWNSLGWNSLLFYCSNVPFLFQISWFMSRIPPPGSPVSSETTCSWMPLRLSLASSSAPTWPAFAGTWGLPPDPSWTLSFPRFLKSWFCLIAWICLLVYLFC